MHSYSVYSAVLCCWCNMLFNVYFTSLCTSIFNVFSLSFSSCFCIFSYNPTSEEPSPQGLLLTLKDCLGIRRGLFLGLVDRDLLALVIVKRNHTPPYPFACLCLGLLPWSASWSAPLVLVALPCYTFLCPASIVLSIDNQQRGKYFTGAPGLSPIMFLPSPCQCHLSADTETATIYQQK